MICRQSGSRVVAVTGPLHTFADIYSVAATHCGSVRACTKDLLTGNGPFDPRNKQAGLIAAQLVFSGGDRR